MGWRENNDTVQELVERQSPSGSGWWRVDCPFCDEVVGVSDRSAALACSSLTGWWNCWRCQTHGRLIGSQFEWEPRPEPTAEEIAAKPEVAFPKDWYPLWKEPGSIADILKPARKYLRPRLPKKRWFQHGIGAVHSGWAGKRIVAPVEDRNGKRVGWVGRSWLPVSVQPKRYLYPPEMDRGRYLFNEEILWDDTNKPVFLVEGCFDCWALWPDAIAFLGKKGSHHLEILRSSTRPLIALLDGDAWRESLALFLQLKVLGKEAAFLRLPAGEDPFSVGRDWISREMTRLK